MTSLRTCETAGLPLAARTDDRILVAVAHPVGARVVPGAPRVPHDVRVFCRAVEGAPAMGTVVRHEIVPVAFLVPPPWRKVRCPGHPATSSGASGNRSRVEKW